MKGNAATSPGGLTLRRRRRMKMRLSKAIAYLVVTLGAIVLLVPFFWMVTTSLKDLNEVFAYPPKWIPKPPQWRNRTAAPAPAPELAQRLTGLVAGWRCGQRDAIAR